MPNIIILVSSSVCLVRYPLRKAADMKPTLGHFDKKSIALIQYIWGHNESWWFSNNVDNKTWLYIYGCKSKPDQLKPPATK